MMKSHLSLLLLITMNGFAQQFTLQWQRTYGGSDAESASSMVLLDNNQLIICGTSSSSNGDVTNSWGNGDIWLLGLDSTGNILWDRSYGSINWDEWGYAICSDSLNGLVFAGTSSGDGQQVSGVHAHIGENDWWIGRVDSMHNLTFQKCLGGYDGDNNVYSIKRTHTGNYLLTGEVNSIDGDVIGNQGGNRGWMVLLNNNLSILFQNLSDPGSLSGTYNAIQSLDSGYYSIGQVEYRSNCSIGESDVAFCKYERTGSKIRENCFGGTLHDGGIDLIENNDGTIWIVGGTFSNDINVTGNHGYSDIWLALIDSNGNVLRQNCFGGMATDLVRKMIKSSDGGLIIVGGTNSTELNGTVINFHGYEDALVIKTDSLGNLLWGQCFGGSEIDEANSVIENADGSLFVLGTTESTDGDVTSNHGTKDYWLMKLVPSPLLVNEQEGVITNLVVNTTFANRNILFHFNSILSSDMAINIYELTGKLIKSINFHSRIGMNNFELPNFNYSSGMYIVELSTKDWSERIKFVSNY